MKIIKGAFFILLFFFIGQVISHFTNNFIPGSIIGMILLFLSLNFKLISPDSVSKVADTLTANMSVFFIPAGVGLLAVTDLISKSWIAILTVCSITTILILVVVAVIQEQMEKHRK